MILCDQTDSYTMTELMHPKHNIVCLILSIVVYRGILIKLCPSLPLHGYFHIHVLVLYLPELWICLLDLAGGKLENIFGMEKYLSDRFLSCMKNYYFFTST